MERSFAEILSVGGKTNSLGEVDSVIATVTTDESRLDELYSCLFDEDAWVRMRAADAIEKICRVHPEWLTPYIDKFNIKLSVSTQPSILWHLAQMYGELELTDAQKRFAISWLKQVLSSKDIDWIVAANAMDTLVQFTIDDSIAKHETIALLEIQLQHKSKSVKKRANKLIDQLS